MLNIPSEERLEKIPGLYAAHDIHFLYRMIYLHFFLNSFDWYVAEFDRDDTFFGFVRSNDPDSDEWCQFSFRELKALNINGVEVDCELEDAWEPQRWQDIPGIMWRK